ncbi:type III-B CRISPR module-associated Cmr3 family protein [Clostridium tagluense]|uniref:type III-B CRISPR module-associated Cmr3 family protein n=1 Tax=Clostridium tagluense TaxID=360422 RepID=UPI001C0AD837|nr:type III-B CRISPR module-associated Cmr3 family protein [Clostridium tagluense]MBU3127896.1 CRISPR-associated protein Cmr3 [Clostridium tagluense]
MELISIKPCNNTFFGDGNQFNFGSNNFIRSKNTPFPSVFFGAIFTAILSENDTFRGRFFKENKYDHEKILKINQVYLYNEYSKQLYIPAPKDLFLDSNDEIQFGKFEKVDKKLNSLSFERILKSPINSDFKKVTNKYINLKNIYDAYLKKQRLRIDLKDEHEIFVKNNKVGIGINKDTKMVEEGNLYKIEQTEFVDDYWSYIVEYEIDKDYTEKEYKGIEIKCLENGYLKLGGESKVCKFEKIKNRKIEEFNEHRKDILKTNILKIVFTSDTFFENNIEEVLKGDIKIIGVANDKPLYIGGYDMKKSEENKTGQVRRMYKGYSAGTIVLIEIVNLEKVKDKILNFRENNIGLSRSKGFGKCIIIEEK